VLVVVVVPVDVVIGDEAGEQEALRPPGELNTDRSAGRRDS
jgi:hypothetical protein